MSDCVSRQTIAQFEYAVTDSRKPQIYTLQLSDNNVLFRKKRIKQLPSGRFFRQIIATNRNKSVIFARYYTHLARSAALSITAGFASLT
ncbi:unknown [Prevotella sp. CAG:873]|nr:unknown [Prevotella sp. CAG:873]